MAVVEGQFQCVLTGRFQAAQADVDLAELQDGFAVALDLGGRECTRRNSAGRCDLAGRVFERQGFRGFVQFDVGGELGHGLTFRPVGAIARDAVASPSPLRFTASHAPVLTYRI
jgi:hypothetical protein